MKKSLKVFFIGLIAGALDLIPLIFVNAPLFNMFSIITFWLVATYIISITEISRNTILNGLFLSILLMVPMALAVSATNPRDFVPMMFMAIVLGPLVGYALSKISQ